MSEYLQKKAHGENLNMVGFRDLYIYRILSCSGRKIFLVGHMGVYENYLVVPLRLLGYDAYIMLLGMSGWQKDYPATRHIDSLLHDAQTQDFPLVK